MLFINHVNPYFRIYVPELETFVEFKGGKLELDEDDPAYATVYAVCEATPNVVILQDAVQCDLCGESFRKGKTAAMQLGKHRKDVHFKEWSEEESERQAQVIRKEIKARQPFACDLCTQVQEFQTEDELAAHIKAVHIDPNADDEGNATGAGGNAANAEPQAAPAAK